VSLAESALNAVVAANLCEAHQLRFGGADRASIVRQDQRALTKPLTTIAMFITLRGRPVFVLPCPAWIWLGHVRGNEREYGYRRQCDCSGDNDNP
jgi:hypothetical protein